MRIKYECPKCHAVVHSSKKPEYCICGGKYETVRKKVDKFINGLGLGDVFGIGK